ncbi:conjugation system TraG family ATPase [Flavobacterium croceum DSM 17960]|uniref:Conjugation system TraG family ATPase n=1 Tax=Flavobacterium croceum DSM 17960 TaxID=1121886 RepID=A0A2S4N5F9_9FLAO|nr:TraG family conjugative transposon ATPase [Flavobacterium croceum]POS00906.1 conjugation system TraG family ATPase [Flavobacterium croceum DSM 17960]
MLKKTTLDSIRPVWEFLDNDTVLMRNGSYSRCFELELSSIFTLNRADYEKINEEFNSILNLLPEYSVIHKMDIYENKTFNKTTSSENFLQKSYFQKYLEKNYLNHKSYIFISNTHSNIFKQSSLSSVLFKNNIIPKKQTDNQNLENFDTIVNRIIRLLNDSKYFKIEPLDIQQIKRLQQQYESLDFTNKIATSDIYQDNYKTKIGKKSVAALSINSLDCLPNEYDIVYRDNKFSTEKSNINFSLFHPVGLGLNFEHITNTIFIKTDKEAIKELITKNEKLNVTFRKADLSNEDNINDSLAFKQQMEKGFYPINYHANILIYDEDIENLKVKIDKTISSLNQIKITPNISENEILPLYWSCYPGNASDIGFIDQTFLLLDNQASALNIYETTNKSDVSEFGVYLIDRISGCPLFVDISDVPMKLGLTNNRNKIIIGPSGSGKSFTTNHLVDSYLATDTHVVIVDVGHSYERLNKLHKGTYLSYEENSPISFNPFYTEIDSNLIEKKETLIALIFTLWKINTSGTADEDAIIREGLNEYYDYVTKNNAFMCFNTYYEFMVEIFLPNLPSETKALFNSASFQNVLKKFYKGGEFDYLLNSKQNINLLNEKLIIFELDNIKDHPILFPIVSLMIMETFITKMRLLKHTRKVIIIEEAWKAIAKEGMANFLKYLFKTVRKHFGEAVIVTQELEDILGNEIIKDTILKNCGAKILLDMREYASNFLEIQKLLSLTDKSKDLVLSLNQNLLPGDRYKEVFIGLGNEGNVYGVSLSKQQYACFTTEKKEKNIIDNDIEKFGDIELALQNYSEKL